MALDAADVGANELTDATYCLLVLLLLFASVAPVFVCFSAPFCCVQAR
jgi:hypothetical protein